MNIDLLRLRAIPSLVGWVIFLKSHPLFAITLLIKRLQYTLTRRMSGLWVGPFGFVVDSSDILISYWGIFVERELQDPSWIKTLQSTTAPCVIDIGANAGVFVHYLYTLRPDVEIIAVEPQKHLAERIANYGRERKANINSIVAACSDHEGTATLYLNYVGDLSASINRDFMQHLSSVDVPLVTVDRIAPPRKIHLLKIDAEGHDYNVLLGATTTLKRTSHVLIEAHKGQEQITKIHNLLGSNWELLQVSAIDYLFTNKLQSSGDLR